MTPTKYQAAVDRTMNNLPREDALVNWALGLSGETGEVIEHIKKFAYHGKPLDMDAVEKELGDVLWYVAAMANTLGLSLDEIMQKNVDKLRERYPDGFPTNVDGVDKKVNE